MRVFFPSCLIALLASTALPLQGDEDKDEILERGRVSTQRFYDQELEELWGRFGDELRGLIGSIENFGAMREQVGAQLGSEKSILAEEVTAFGSGWIYVRTAQFENLPQTIEIVFNFEADDRIAGFQIRPKATEAPSKFLDYETKTELRLPFEGEWFVFWGGRTLRENYHTAYPDQRFAYDLLWMKDGSTHSGDGTRNEDYYCFAKPILAPGAGKVVVVVEGVEDNVPGEMNPAQAAGNHVVLDHGNGEFSLLAHFKKGTLIVKKGDSVESGQKLGLSGNSGNSSEPHLHYHLQNTAVFGVGLGLPSQFVDYVSDGKPVERGEPVKGQRIRRP